MPYLVSVSGSRIPLRRGHFYVMGRGADCDLVISDPVCSRRHASITVADGVDQISIDDMDSRNGTYLNGRPILGPTFVPGGGRLRIGATIFLLQLHEEARRSNLEETCTISDLDPGRSVRDIDGGELSTMGTLETLRLLVTARRSVTMHVALPAAAARVELRNGEILSARHGDLEGFNALVKLGREPSGIFWLIDSTGHCQRNITDASARLLFELGRCLGAVAAPLSSRTP
jgi:hypothetical protein